MVQIRGSACFPAYNECGGGGFHRSNLEYRSVVEKIFLEEKERQWKSTAMHVWENKPNLIPVKSEIREIATPRNSRCTGSNHAR
ncbi:rho-related GTP-binding protein RhoH isoform X2 [Hemicordylus capensis]|uniref:rho-related GTP-binding protein RhoH isoform X2 n=1 Tax=Hemicordylus capensis TaxID=884348 RepID=UPI0023022934|nr:rho-related GTP-binding protein RhoH isoform X2 [Hemicordylus capensis]